MIENKTQKKDRAAVRIAPETKVWIESEATRLRLFEYEVIGLMKVAYEEQQAQTGGLSDTHNRGDKDNVNICSESTENQLQLGYVSTVYAGLHRAADGGDTEAAAIVTLVESWAERHGLSRSDSAGLLQRADRILKDAQQTNSAIERTAKGAGAVPTARIHGDRARSRTRKKGAA